MNQNKKSIDDRKKRIKTAMIKHNLIRSIESSNYLCGAYRSLCLLYPDNEDFRNKYHLFCKISEELSDIYVFAFYNINKKGTLSWAFINEYYDNISNLQLKLSMHLTGLYKEDCFCGALDKERDRIMPKEISSKDNKQDENFRIPLLEKKYNIEYADLSSVLKDNTVYTIKYIGYDYSNILSYYIYFIDKFDWCYIRKDNDTVYKCKVHKE